MPLAHELFPRNPEQGGAHAGAAGLGAAVGRLLGQRPAARRPARRVALAQRPVANNKSPVPASQTRSRRSK